MSRRPLPAILAVGCLVVGACVTTEEAPPTNGAVQVGNVSGVLSVADCANTIDGPAVGAVGETPDGIRVKVEVTPTPDGSAVTITGDKNGEPRFQFVAGETEVSDDPSGKVSVTGVFQEFDGAERVDEVDGSLDVTCPRDRDPGGGTLSVASQVISYSIVVCFQDERQFELRARGGDPIGSESLTLTRNREIDGWTDRLEASGSTQLSDEEQVVAVDTPLADATALVTINEAQVIMDEREFGDDGTIRASLDLTCGVLVD